jgi:hypothetical protein
VAPVFIKGNGALVTSDRSIYIPNTFPKIESVIINMFHTIINPNSIPGFIKSKSTAANLVGHLDFIFRWFIFGNRLISVLIPAMRLPQFRKNSPSVNQMTADCLLVTKTDSGTTLSNSTPHVRYCGALYLPQ